MPAAPVAPALSAFQKRAIAERMQKARAKKDEIREARPSDLEKNLRERAFSKLEVSRRASLSTTSTPVVEDAPPEGGLLIEDLTDESEVEATPKPYESDDAPGAAARRAWCDEEETKQQADLQRSTPPAAAPTQPRSCERQQREPLSQQLAATLCDLLDLHDFGEQVTWPNGFDARTAREALATSNA